jgi:hypothetical protein
MARLGARGDGDRRRRRATSRWPACTRASRGSRSTTATPPRAEDLAPAPASCFDVVLALEVIEHVVADVDIFLGAAADAWSRPAAR